MIAAGFAVSCFVLLLFLWIAFGSLHGWWQLSVVKIAVLMLATPVAALIRRRLAVPGNSIDPARV